jgi:voltage-gated potassium channel
MITSDAERSDAARHVRLGVAAVLAVLIGGTAGFVVFEHVDVLDAFFNTIGLMSTTGGLEQLTTPAGRLLGVGVIILGIGALFYTLGSLAEYLIEGHFGRAIARRRMDRRIAQLRGHIIICGYGRVGRRIVRECVEGGRAFVVVDLRDANIAALAEARYLYVQGDATEDATLHAAGILQAGTLLAATDADTENIAITLSARALAPDLWIVARANHDESEHKLRRAGANRVLSPYALGGHRMAILAMQPHLADFLDTALQGSDLDVALRVIEVEPDSALAGVPLPSGVHGLPPACHDCTVIAVRPAGTRQWIAASQHQGVPLTPGDFVIVLGPVAARQRSREGSVSTNGATEPLSELPER